LSPATKRSSSARLEEAVGLALAINLNVVGQQVISLNKRVPSTLIGKGNVESLKAIVASNDIDLVVVDTSLTPTQQRTLEKTWKCKVIDRTGLILEIFGERANTAEGRLQVELAALTYQRSRLVRSWTHLERQRGGYGFLGGPGESQIEMDRRLIDERIAKIKKELIGATRTRGLHRQARKRVPYPIVALVGYTNAGKSTLFNRLTNSAVFAEDLLFATLDPTLRQLKLPSGRKIILSDTVGFISDLPTQLIAAFRATLEEVCSADLIIHIRDCAHPDSMAQAEDVYKVLHELGLEDTIIKGEMIEVFNKVDLLPSEERNILQNRLIREPSSIAISALQGESVDKLLMLIDQRLNAKRQTAQFTIAIEDGKTLAWLYKHGEIISRQDEETVIHLTVQLDSGDMEKLKKMRKEIEDKRN
jgi:GTP-binding protein HflX